MSIRGKKFGDAELTPMAPRPELKHMKKADVAALRVAAEPKKAKGKKKRNK